MPTATMSNFGTMVPVGATPWWEQFNPKPPESSSDPARTTKTIYGTITSPAPGMAQTMAFVHHYIYNPTTGGLINESFSSGGSRIDLDPGWEFVSRERFGQLAEEQGMMLVAGRGTYRLVKNPHVASPVMGPQQESSAAKWLLPVGIGAVALLLFAR